MDRFPQPAGPQPLLIKNLLLHPQRWLPGQMIHYRDHALTYSEFFARVSRLAGLLRRLGVRPGEAVGVMDWDSHRYLEFFFAVPMCGAVLHTVNIRLSPAQILYTVNHAADVVLFVHDDFIPQVEKFQAGIAAPCRIVRHTPEHFAVIERLLREDYSLRQIVGRLRLEGVRVMSHETIYLHVWADRAHGGTLWRHLRHLTKVNRKRYARHDSRGRLTGKRMITERPAIVDRRERLGDWEIDTVHGLGKTRRGRSGRA